MSVRVHVTRPRSPRGLEVFRRKLKHLAAEARVLAAPEAFADALARRLRTWHLTPNMDAASVDDPVGGKTKRSDDGGSDDGRERNGAGV